MFYGCFLGAVALGWTQEAAPKPKKVLTPEQQQMQQQYRATTQQMMVLRTQAKQAFDGEMEREKAGDCPEAHTTYDFNMCYEKVLKETGTNLKAYEIAVRSILGLQFPSMTGQQATTGIAGPVLTPEQQVAEFDKMEKTWRTYQDIACSAAFHTFGGGTGGPSAEAECELRLMRGHMRELDGIYYMRLHL
jgi:hypothetical protein